MRVGVGRDIGEILEILMGLGGFIGEILFIQYLQYFSNTHPLPPMGVGGYWRNLMRVGMRGDISNISNISSLPHPHK